MKQLKITLLAIFCVLALQSTAQTWGKVDANKKQQLAKVSCGTCQFGMEGKGCEIAVKINNKNYFVKGPGLNDMGDAHAKDGFCNAVRKGTVQGEVKEDGFFHANYVELKSPGKGKKAHKH